MNQIHTTSRAALLVLVGILFIGFTPVKADTVLIDFGSSSNQTTVGGTSWNNITTPGVGTSSLVDTTGASFGSLTIDTAFAGVSTTGYAGGAIGIFPSSATSDDFYIGSAPGSSATMTLSGLDTSGNTTYTFTFLTSKAAASDDGGGTRQIGLTFGSAPTVDQIGTDPNPTVATGNANLVTVSNVAQDGSGNILITVTNPGNYFAYLNVLQIDAVSSTPEPSTIALSILGGLGLFVVVVRRRQLAQV